ncbi:radical SAM family heme chaperone HemW [Nibricoccus sp. IMCC34717]|uniref:radical SAM family heme chaperone HemW n=1 Tax=Nibricoccus sp. IMCC34717 TaxID=3034021 RepID=UPI00384D2145
MAIRENAGLTPRGTALGLYVHVPFCASTCDFCAFYQERPDSVSIDTYLSGIETEAPLVSWDAPVSTVFWGGGTPGLLAAEDMQRLGEALKSSLGGTPLEWSVELAPGSVTVERLQALKEIGVTRVSLGVQTFREDLLKALNRRHGPAQIFRAYERIREVGFASVNLDFMFALPGQEEEDWLADLRQAVALAPDHLSTYCLTFEEDTALWVKLSQGQVKLDPERERALYERTWGELEAAGFAQYEVSNFAKPGHRCIHNVNTWRMQEWVGLGPSAASQHAGWRGTNQSNLKDWVMDLASDTRATDDRLRLGEDQLAEDAVIFGLRMNEGVDLEALQRRFPQARWSELEPLSSRLVAEELAQLEKGVLRLTLKGRLLADAIGSEILYAFTLP